MLSARPSKCKLCGERTDSCARLLHDECIPGWIEELAKRKKAAAEKKSKIKEKVDRALLRQYREKHKTIADRVADARAEFNAWTRLRDKDQPCISCGAMPKVGFHAGRDAGHYRSTGAAPWLRFHPDNCHAQCVECNQHRAGNVVMYRKGLIARIGLERVEALENDSGIGHKWTHQQLIDIKLHYRERRKELEKQG